MPYLYFLLYCLSATVSADTLPERQLDLSVDDKLSFSRLLEQVFQQHPEQLKLKAHENEHQALTEESQHWLRAAPELGLSLQDDTLGSDVGAQEWQLSVDLPLLLPKQRQARQALLPLWEQVHEREKQVLKLTLAGRLRQALWAVVKQENQAQLAQQALEEAKALQNDVHKRYKAGELAKTDDLSAAQEVLNKEAEYLDVDEALQLAWQRYSALTLTQNLPFDFRESQSEQEHIVTHPQLALLHAKLLLAQAQKQQVRTDSGYQPDVRFNLKRERGAHGGGYDNSIGLGFSVPLNGKAYKKTELAEAQSLISAQQSAQQQSLWDLELALHTAARRLENQRLALKQVEARQKLARENLKLIRKAFDLGESDLLSLLRAQNNFFVSTRAKRQRKIQLQQSIADYNQAVGELP